MKGYILSNTAKSDIITIYRYGLHRFGLKQADKYYDQLFEQFDIIAERPFSFPAVDYIKEGYRRSVLGPNSIYFRINDTRVEIMAIIGYQDVKNFLNA